MSNDECVILDRRQHHFSIVDNTVVDKYFRLVGAEAFGIYVVLTRFASNATQTCWPSQQKLSEIAGISRVSANRAVRILVLAGLVSVRKRTNETGAQMSCEYTLLPVKLLEAEDATLIMEQISAFRQTFRKSSESTDSAPVEPEKSPSPCSPVIHPLFTGDTPPCSPVIQGGVSGLYTNKTQSELDLIELDPPFPPQAGEASPAPSSQSTCAARVVRSKRQPSADPRVAIILKQIDKIFSIGNWPRETNALKKILALPIAPVEQEIVVAFRRWVAERNTLKYGASLWQFLDVASNEIQRLRGVLPNHAVVRTSSTSPEEIYARAMAKAALDPTFDKEVWEA